MTTNVFTQLSRLVGSAPLLRGVILSASQGFARVELSGGLVLTVRGEGAVGAAVYVRSGVIEGPAPELAAMVTLEV